MGGAPFNRVFNLIHALFIVIWVIFVKNLSVRAIPLKDRNVYKIIIRILLTLLLFVVVNSNYVNLIMDSVENVPKYQKEMANRYELIKNNTGGEMVLPKIKSYPVTFHNADITTDPDSWVNECYEEYFHLKSVRLE